MRKITKPVLLKFLFAAVVLILSFGLFQFGCPRDKEGYVNIIGMYNVRYVLRHPISERSLKLFLVILPSFLDACEVLGLYDKNSALPPDYVIIH